MEKTIATLVLQVCMLSCNAMEPKNCVDACIFEYCLTMGDLLDEQRWSCAVAKCGLPKSAPKRKLAQCKQILRALGHRFSPIYANARYLKRYSKCLIFLPSNSMTEPGHLVFSRYDDGCLYLFDPSSEPRWRQFDPPNDETQLLLLVPTKTAFAHHAGQLLLASLTYFAVASVFLLFVRVWSSKRFRRATTAGVLVIPFLLIGCDDMRQLNMGVTEHNFGVVEYDPAAPVKSHTFRLTNHSRSKLELGAVSTSCSCAIADLHGFSKYLNPGDTVQIPVRINLSDKNGPFYSEVRVKFSGDPNLKDVSLVLTGSVFKPPIAKYTVIPLATMPGLVHRDQLEIWQAYDRGHPHDRLIKMECSGDCSNFRLGEPSLSVREIPNNWKEASWLFPVSFEPLPSATIREHIAEFRLTWSSGAESQVQFRGYTLPAVRIPSPILLPKLEVGKKLVEKIPIEITDKEDQVSFGETSDDLELFIDMKQGELILSVVPTMPGDFSRVVKFKSSGLDYELQIKGFVE